MFFRLYLSTVLPAWALVLPPYHLTCFKRKRTRPTKLLTLEIRVSMLSSFLLWLVQSWRISLSEVSKDDCEDNLRCRWPHKPKKCNLSWDVIRCVLHYCGWMDQMESVNSDYRYLTYISLLGYELERCTAQPLLTEIFSARKYINLSAIYAVLWSGIGLVMYFVLLLLVCTCLKPSLQLWSKF